MRLAVLGHSPVEEGRHVGYAPDESSREKMSCLCRLSAVLWVDESPARMEEHLRPFVPQSTARIDASYE